MHDHNFSITELDEFMPWERDVYLILLKEWLKEERQRIESENSRARSPRGMGR